MKFISLMAIDGLGTETQEYDQICNKTKNNLSINEVIFLTPNLTFKNDNFKVIYLDNPFSYCDLNVFMFQKLGNYITNSHCLIVQTDGFPINYDLWDDDYLNYDYIGAPWPKGMRWTGNEEVVGNGGFSLRSKKLYDITKRIEGFEQFHKNTLTNEDVTISVGIRKILEENNIKFAPVELARKFSIEIPIDENHKLKNCFGFHGKKYTQELKDINHELFARKQS